MTIKVIIENDENSPESPFLHVAVRSEDIYGNKVTSPMQIYQIAPGEKREFCIHKACDLRVYETNNNLVK